MTTTSVTGMTLKNPGKKLGVDEQPVRTAVVVHVQVADLADVLGGLVEQVPALQFLGGE